MQEGAPHRAQAPTDTAAVLCFGTKPGLIRLCGHRGGVTVEFERNVYYQMFHLLKKSNSNRLVSFPVQVQMYAKRLLHRCRVRYAHVAAACL